MKNVQTSTFDAKQFSQFKNQLVILAKITSPYNINFIEAFKFQNHHFLVIDDMLEYGPLKDVINARHYDYTESFARYALNNIAQGIKTLHQAHIVHRGISEENIYCTAEYAKLAVFTQSVFLTEREIDRTSRFGEEQSSAPEILLGVAYGKPIDIWSLGLLAYHLASGRPLFSQENHSIKVLEEDHSEELYKLPECEDATKTPFSDAYQQFINKCLAVEPSQRPTIETLLEEPLLKGAEQF